MCTGVGHHVGQEARRTQVMSELVFPATRRNIVEEFAISRLVRLFGRSVGCCVDAGCGHCWNDESTMTRALTTATTTSMQLRTTHAAHAVMVLGDLATWLL